MFLSLKYHLGRLVLTMAMVMASCCYWEEVDMTFGNPRSKYGPNVTLARRKGKCRYRTNVRWDSPFHSALWNNGNLKI